MPSLVKFNRVLPLVFPEVFPVAASTEPAMAAGTTGAADHERRLKQLYQRSLRGQRNTESLTYSGALSA